MGAGFVGERKGLVKMARDEGHPNPESLQSFGELLNWIASQSSRQDLKKFRNPGGYWEHKGVFSVDLTPDAYKDIVPDGAKIKGNTVHAQDGVVKLEPRGIRLCTRGANRGSIWWPFIYVKVVRDGEGKPIWVNKLHA